MGHGPSGRGAVFVLTATPGVKGIPDDLDGVKVVSHAIGKFFALRPDLKPCGKGKNPTPCPEPPPDPDPDPSTDCIDPTSRCDRPVPIGVSTGHPSVTAGTIGARVVDGQGTEDTADDLYYALSNNHVYADVNSASIGDKVIQPGTFDGGSSPADDISTLAAYKIIAFDGSANLIDTAISATTTEALDNSTSSSGYGTPSSTTKTVRINEKVKKYGRTTGQTKGFVWALNGTVNVNYGAVGVARFEGQIFFKGNGTFSALGDSGSLIVTQKGGSKPVALLFAGSSQLNIGNPIDAVLSEFGIAIDGQ